MIRTTKNKRKSKIRKGGSSKSTNKSPNKSPNKSTNKSTNNVSNYKDAFDLSIMKSLKDPKKKVPDLLTYRRVIPIIDESVQYLNKNPYISDAFRTALNNLRPDFVSLISVNLPRPLMTHTQDDIDKDKKVRYLMSKFLDYPEYNEELKHNGLIKLYINTVNDYFIAYELLYELSTKNRKLYVKIEARALGQETHPFENHEYKYIMDLMDYLMQL
jgi:hypothetical protein